MKRRCFGAVLVGGFAGLLMLFAIAVLLCGCAEKPKRSANNNEEAKALFEATTKQFHIPSADAHGPERQRMQNQALAGYLQLLKRYPGEDYWAAQALRSMANIYAAQTNLNAALGHYAQVEAHYPMQNWQVLMAWKSAADLLWDANRFDEAKKFYTKIVQRFDHPDTAQVFQTVVRGSRMRLTSREPV